jgi:uncharacterized protein
MAPAYRLTPALRLADEQVVKRGLEMDFKEKYGPWAIIAGASEGVGRSFARQIAAQGVSCILIANKGPLEEAAAEIRSESGVECIIAEIDLSSPDALDQIIAAAGTREVGLYIANAGGNAPTERFLDAELKAWVRLTNINVMTTMQACHHFGRLMRERGRGGLLTVNSGACYGGGSYLSIYTACKAFLLNFAESLWAESRKSGVDVLTIVLDKTDTPNFRRMLEKLGQPWPSDVASPDEVARMGLARLPHGPIHNWGQEDDEPGQGWASARERRQRVTAMSDVVEQLYGKEAK